MSPFIIRFNKPYAIKQSGYSECKPGTFKRFISGILTDDVIMPGFQVFVQAIPPIFRNIIFVPNKIICLWFGELWLRNISLLDSV